MTKQFLLIVHEEQRFNIELGEEGSAMVSCVGQSFCYNSDFIFYVLLQRHKEESRSEAFKIITFISNFNYNSSSVFIFTLKLNNL